VIGVIEDILGDVQAAIAVSVIQMRTFDAVHADFMKALSDCQTVNGDLTKGLRSYADGEGLGKLWKEWKQHAIGQQTAPVITTAVVGKAHDTARRRPPGIYPDHKYEYKPDTDASARALRAWLDEDDEL
jgi:hypothetical protein